MCKTQRFAQTTEIPKVLLKYLLVICFCHSNLKSKMNLRIGSCLACVYRVMDAHEKFGEHDGRSARVAQGAAESNSSFLSALQTSQVHEPKA